MSEPTKPPSSRNLLSMRRLRSSRHAQGLNSKGHQRVNRSHPKLHGLKDKKLYHRLFMQGQRERDRAGYGQIGS